MKLLELISFCKLKGIVTEHSEADAPGWDTDADKHGQVTIENNKFVSTVKYATVGEGVAIMNTTLREKGAGGSREEYAEFFEQVSISRLVEVFVECHEL